MKLIFSFFVCRTAAQKKRAEAIAKKYYYNYGSEGIGNEEARNMMAEKQDLCDALKLNLVVRRKPKENNFKSVLETIRTLLLSASSSTSRKASVLLPSMSLNASSALTKTFCALPDWLHEVFLGYGDTARVTHLNPKQKLDFCDTLIDFDHLKESWPDKKVSVVGEAKTDKNFERPFRVHFPVEVAAGSVRANERSKSKALPSLENSSAGRSIPAPSSGELYAEPYKLQKAGPYPEDIPNHNQVRFTPVQVSAIASGMEEGMTLIVGPPGTGKTDIAVQIISNLYHNNPMEKTLLVTHSNQALNHLFEKLINLDIDERHLLRLGHGQKQVRPKLSGSRSSQTSL